MTVDPSDPETFEANEPPEIDVEAPEADTAEQFMEVSPGQEDVPEEVADPDGADEGDRVEQARVVAIDEDDYR
ncbi:hypothetical protein OKJ48_24660 [Streptomyces kunmingensis]|uniref:Uncharacterized protein n=1 Tax=Streptomyces kunmingensis TaxID=68225 RepID=A0ABU6CGV5_9ACTN|nr:hypothetical protein [Streptomyces kunmingensis]MEB3963411.1 hypothetical protein [Streptomyces kunmingensis]